jgi:hypothetical protein
MKKQNVKRAQRLGVKLLLIFPDLHAGKSYIDNNRNHQYLVDGQQRTKLGLCEEFKLRSLIVVKKRYGVHSHNDSGVDSTFTYRVGENFAELQVKGKPKVRVSISFESGNILNILDNTSFYKQSSIIK